MYKVLPFDLRKSTREEGMFRISWSVINRICTFLSFNVSSASAISNEVKKYIHKHTLHFAVLINAIIFFNKLYEQLSAHGLLLYMCRLQPLVFTLVNTQL